MPKTKYPYPTQPRRSNPKSDYKRGYCFTCGFEIEGPNAVGVMAQHAGRTGHRCWVDIEYSLQWGDVDEHLKEDVKT